MQELYLLRHGIAEDPQPGQRDADRALTEEGIKKLRATLTRAKEAGVSPTLIISSPLKRAMQTADVAAQVFGYKGKILLSRALEPSGSPDEVWSELRGHRDEESILLSGHEPLFSGAAAFLLNSPALAVDFKKGALLRVDLDPARARPAGILRWFLTSKLA